MAHWGSEFIGAPAFWIQTKDREDTVAAALCLQRDAGLMSSNLQILCQFVTSLNRMSSEVLRLVVGPVAFPSAAVDSLSPVPRAPRAANYMSAMGLWRPLGGPSGPGPLPASSCDSCINHRYYFPDLPNPTGL